MRTHRTIDKMSVAGVKFKIMPEGLDVDLEKLQADSKTAIETFEGAVFNEAIEEPIAFGLKALIITSAIPESTEVDEVESKLSELEGASSVEMIDYRRAVG